MAAQSRIPTGNGPSSHLPQGLAWSRRLRGGRLWAPLDMIGHQLHFAGLVIRGMWMAITTYRRQIGVTFTELAWGRGAFVVGGGVAPVLVILGVAVGAMIGILGHTVLNVLGLGPISGVISAYGATREFAPITAAIGFAAQAGCRLTAEIGSMRISEEIDALEAQAVQPIPFVVSTRVVAGVITIIPTYLITLALSYLSAQVVITVIQGESTGAYGHYFHMFVNGRDVLMSLIKVIVFVVIVIVTHCYQGYYASGGPEGVGIASGRAIRASLVLVIVADMVLTILMWGFHSTISFSG
ncbi:MlaE family ABC transporter permease [Nocardia vaccinii]|uniref:MlaE family ABC transporter permease n=1 Tax=Nocardia vaccinii TaxID=1822 RepID=UPI00082DAEC7|nr:ABC transporter permease [Nocardia vaccinii]